MKYSKINFEKNDMGFYFVKNVQKSLEKNVSKQFILLIITAIYILINNNSVQAQIPTLSIPTVTGTDQGVVVTVKNDPANPQINLRAGPGTEYDKVGTMVIGQKAVAKERTEGVTWLLIEYPGAPGGYAWVY